VVGWVGGETEWLHGWEGVDGSDHIRSCLAILACVLAALTGLYIQNGSCAGVSNLCSALLVISGVAVAAPVAIDRESAGARHCCVSVSGRPSVAIFHFQHTVRGSLEPVKADRKVCRPRDRDIDAIAVV
jgi:hypothetical protein